MSRRSMIGSLMLVAALAVGFVASATYHSVSYAIARVTRVVDWCLKRFVAAVSPKSPAVTWVRVQAYKLGLQRRERPRLFSTWRMVSST